jgi:hypothetical protein
MKRTNSNENVGQNVGHTTEPRLFQKSDFAIGKKMGKGQFG